jgi:hypothetical protein
MTERILEEVSLERYISSQVGCENDSSTTKYVFEYDIQTSGLRKKLKDYTLKRKKRF